MKPRIFYLATILLSTQTHASDEIWTDRLTASTTITLNNGLSVDVALSASNGYRIECLYSDMTKDGVPTKAALWFYPGLSDALARNTVVDGRILSFMAIQSSSGPKRCAKIAWEVAHASQQNPITVTVKRTRTFEIDPFVSFEH